MRTTGRRRAAAVIAAVVLVASVLSGCSWLSSPPPEAAVASVEALRVRLEAVDGVGEVETSLYSPDVLRSSGWVASVDVTAETPDLTVAAAVRGALGDGVAQAQLDLTLEVPEGPGSAGVTLDPQATGDVDLADAWRRIPGTATMHLTSDGRWVALREGTTVAVAADRFRPTLGDGIVLLQDEIVSVGVTATAPGPALLSAIDALAARQGVSGVYSTPGPDMGRGAITVETDDVERVAAVLAATADEAADAGSGPRTAFTVRTAYAPDWTSDDEREVKGWVGLPLGSPEPDDLPQRVAPEAPADPPVPDAPVALVDVAAQEAGVRAFLEAAVAAAGVPAEVTTGATSCEDGSAATQATGRVLIPVFTAMDDAQIPFARGPMRASWRAAARWAATSGPPVTGAPTAWRRPASAERPRASASPPSRSACADGRSVDGARRPRRGGPRVRQSAASRAAHAVSHRRHSSAQIRQCSCVSPWWAHSSAHAPQAARHSSSARRVRSARSTV
jgi:hypothetical protein